MNKSRKVNAFRVIAVIMAVAMVIGIGVSIVGVHRYVSKEESVHTNKLSYSPYDDYSYEAYDEYLYNEADFSDEYSYYGYCDSGLNDVADYYYYYDANGRYISDGCYDANGNVICYGYYDNCGNYISDGCYDANGNVICYGYYDSYGNYISDGYIDYNGNWVEYAYYDSWGNYVSYYDNLSIYEEYSVNDVSENYEYNPISGSDYNIDDSISCFTIHDIMYNPGYWTADSADGRNMMRAFSVLNSYNGGQGYTLRSGETFWWDGVIGNCLDYEEGGVVGGTTAPGGAICADASALVQFFAKSFMEITHENDRENVEYFFSKNPHNNYDPAYVKTWMDEAMLNFDYDNLNNWSNLGITNYTNYNIQIFVYFDEYFNIHAEMTIYK